MTDAKSEAEKVAQDIAYRLVGMREIYRENVPQILGCIREPIEEILSKRDQRIAELMAEVTKVKELDGINIRTAQNSMIKISEQAKLLARCREGLEIINESYCMCQDEKHFCHKEISTNILTVLNQAGIGKDTDERQKE
mgnify:CR=1 FL=1